ncbi:hypothetical protein CBR_g18610 [Chara braunii]|uniref:Uncharacterized protein n=1 Tax=Chara braunii TaxID=69332 RepID=A0A388JT76_CHABU|nr:hypothetical protein CBR_g18610 [Chara braunii]|eukprot:GBG61014.1 hypothetical protein CBR_g18610 [Chara braunii]
MKPAGSHEPFLDCKLVSSSEKNGKEQKQLRIRLAPIDAIYSEEWLLQFLQFLQRDAFCHLRPHPLGKDHQQDLGDGRQQGVDDLRGSFMRSAAARRVTKDFQPRQPPHSSPFQFNLVMGDLQLVLPSCSSEGSGEFRKGESGRRKFSSMLCAPFRMPARDPAISERGVGSSPIHRSATGSLNEAANTDGVAASGSGYKVADNGMTSRLFSEPTLRPIDADRLLLLTSGAEQEEEGKAKSKDNAGKTGGGAEVDGGLNAEVDGICIQALVLMVGGLTLCTREALKSSVKRKLSDCERWMRKYEGCKKDGSSPSSESFSLCFTIEMCLAKLHVHPEHSVQLTSERLQVFDKVEVSSILGFGLHSDCAAACPQLVYMSFKCLELRCSVSSFALGELSCLQRLANTINSWVSNFRYPGYQERRALPIQRLGSTRRPDAGSNSSSVCQKGLIASVEVKVSIVSIAMVQYCPKEHHSQCTCEICLSLCEAPRNSNAGNESRQIFDVQLRDVQFLHQHGCGKVCDPLDHLWSCNPEGRLFCFNIHAGPTIEGDMSIPQ